MMDMLIARLSWRVKLLALSSIVSAMQIRRFSALSTSRSVVRSAVEVSAFAQDRRASLPSEGGESRNARVGEVLAMREPPASLSTMPAYRSNAEASGDLIRDISFPMAREGVFEEMRSFIVVRIACTCNTPSLLFSPSSRIELLYVRLSSLAASFARPVRSARLFAVTAKSDKTISFVVSVRFVARFIVSVVETCFLCNCCTIALLDTMMTKREVKMDEYTFEDAIARSKVTCSYPGLEVVRTCHMDREPTCTSLFFPGCSFLNYALPLVQSVYELLEGAGEVDGQSLLCCGKILEYEGDGGVMRAAFEEQFRQHIARTPVKRIVAACPNCVRALRKLLSADEATEAIEVVPLPVVLVGMGYRVDPEMAANFARRDGHIGAGDPVVFCPKDTCPDRATGEFADSLRAIMEQNTLVEPKFSRKRSYCCGSRPRAAGHYELGDKMARRHGAHARDVGANVIVTPCVSCTYSIFGSGCDVPVYHYLELLFDWRIPWELTQGYLKLRFLFDDAAAERDARGYKGLSE